MAKCNDDNDAARPLEPVLPFFSMPEAPVVTRFVAAAAADLPRDLSNVVARGDSNTRGYQDSCIFGDSAPPQDNSIATGTTTIDCFVGDQRQSHDKNLLLRRRIGNSHLQSSSYDGRNDFPVVCVTTATTPADGKHHGEFQVSTLLLCILRSFLPPAWYYFSHLSTQYYVYRFCRSPPYRSILSNMHPPVTQLIWYPF